MVYTQAGTERRTPQRDPSGIGVGTPNHLIHNSVRTNGQTGLRFAMRQGDSRLEIRVNFINIGPDSLPPGALQQNDVFADIRLTGAGVHTLDGITIKLTVRNQNAAGGRDVIPLLPYWFFNRVELQANGSFTDDTIYPTQMYLRHTHAHMFDDVKALESEWIGMEAATSFTRSDPRTLWNCYDEDGIAIPAASSKDYFIPLHNFLTTTSLFMPTKQQDPRVRFYFAANPIRSDNDPADLAGTPIRLEGMLAILRGIIYENEILLNLSAYYSSISIVMPTIVHERQVIDIKTASTGVEISDQGLTSLNGEYVGFFVWLQRGNATREQLYSSNNTWTLPTQAWLPLDNISLKDSSGNPIGFNAIPGGYIKGTLMKEAFPQCSMSAMKDVYFFPFAKNLIASLADGLPSGGMYFDSNFTMSVTPGPIAANPATLNFQLWVFGFRKAQFIMSDSGLFTVKKQ